MTPQGIQSYQRTSIGTADRRKIIALLYEGVIRNLNQAITAIESGDAETFSLRINKALDIVNFLSASLDHAKGGDISRNLQNLYDYCRDIVNQANIGGETEPLREAIGLIDTILDGWKQIANSPEAAEALATGQSSEETVSLRSAPEAKPEAPTQVVLAEDEKEFQADADFAAPKPAPTPKKQTFAAYGGGRSTPEIQRLSQVVG